MSFSFSFAAKSTEAAKRKLAEANAPAAVKALVEKALDAIPVPVPQPLTGSINVSSATDGRTLAGASKPPTFFGVQVEVWGHIAEPGERTPSEIQRFIVRPLFD